MLRRSLPTITEIAVLIGTGLFVNVGALAVTTKNPFEDRKTISAKIEETRIDSRIIPILSDLLNNNISNKRDQKDKDIVEKNKRKTLDKTENTPEVSKTKIKIDFALYAVGEIRILTIENKTKVKVKNISISLSPSTIVVNDIKKANLVKISQSTNYSEYPSSGASTYGYGIQDGFYSIAIASFNHSKSFGDTIAIQELDPNEKVEIAISGGARRFSSERASSPYDDIRILQDGTIVEIDSQRDGFISRVYSWIDGSIIYLVLVITFFPILTWRIAKIILAWNNASNINKIDAVAANREETKAE